MIGYIKSTVVLISQLKGAVHLVVPADPRNVPPVMFTLITLITYLLSLYFCFVLPWLALAHLSLHLTAPCVDLSTYVIKSFLFFLFFAPIIFCLCHYCQTKFDVEISPLGSCLSLFIFFHLSIFSSPLTLPDLLQPAFFTCLFLSLCSLCFFAAVRVSRTEQESVRFRPPLSSTAPYPNATTHTRSWHHPRP